MYTCAACGIQFTRASSLERHNDVCKFALSNWCHERAMAIAAKKAEKLLKEAEKQIKTLTKDLKRANDKLAAQSNVSCSPIVPKKDLRFENIAKSPSFTCSLSEIPLRLANNEYKFDGIEGLLTFITPIIKQGDFKCYVRTDPTRLNYYRYTKGSWSKDPNALFIREILDEMIPHVKACTSKYIEDISNVDIDEQPEKWEKYYKVIEPFSISVIRFEAKSRNVLIKDIAARLSYITDIVGPKAN